MKKTEFRFKMLRIRQKISLMAFINHMTITELFMNAILTTFNNRFKDGLLNINNQYN